MQPITDMIAFVEALGVVVIRRDFGTDAQDGVSLSPPSRRPVMVINTSLPGDRQRMSVGHELGHLVLHGWQVASGEDSVEQEAFAFAGELIAPQGVMQQRLVGLTDRAWRRLLTVKDEFGISISAQIEQGRRLGVIDDTLYRTLRIKLNSLGWTKIEPGTVPEEHPHLMNQVVDAHLDRLGRRLDEVASTALMLPDPFVRHYVTHRSDVGAIRPGGSQR
jgi:Zn-dependent peptidase ImmA (M78 family)